jgi:hypothetical protein
MALKPAPVHRRASLPRAALALECSIPSARDLVEKGILRSYKIGSHWKFSDEQIAAARQRLEELAMGGLK